MTVIAHYRHEDGLDWVRVCAINRGENENGVGFFGPSFTHGPQHHTVQLSVTILLPTRGFDADSPLRIKNFETDLPIFAHHIEDLGEKVMFNTLSLTTAHAPIEVENLRAKRATANTENASITGRFNVTSSLRLHTINSPIKIQAGLYHSGGSGVTVLEMTNTNGPIDSNLNLVSEKETGGRFKVSASTALSPVELIFLSAPVSSSLSLSATTHLGPVRVHLHRTYEGKFEAHSTMSQPTVIYDHDEEDPTGKGRKREVHVVRSADFSISGCASWSEKGIKSGKVKIETTLAPVTLNL